MSTPNKVYTRQLIVRITPELYEKLEADAERFGRTVAQSARFYLRQAMAIMNENGDES